MKVLIFGGSGLVGSRFTTLHKNSFEILAPDVEEIDILNNDSVKKTLEEFSPDTVINFAAYTNVEEAETQIGDKNGICYKINAVGAKNVADALKKSGVHLIHISTEYVFDGEKKDSPYNEEDKPNPINWYGATKHFADEFVMGSGANYTIARICMPYSANYELKKDIARFFITTLKEGNKITAVLDQRITPTLVDNIANALKVLVEQKRNGIYNISCTENTTPFEFAKLLAKKFGYKKQAIEAISLDEFNKKKKAPLLRYSWLNPSKFIHEFGQGILCDLEESIEILKRQMV